MKLELLLLLLLSSCGAVLDPTASSPFSPRLPGGNTNIAVTYSVANVMAVTSTPGQITLTWNNPSIYLFTTFKIHAYKRTCYSESSSCVINTPVAGGVSVFEIYSDTGSSLVDTVGITSGQNYTYWVFVEKDGVFDTGIKTGVASPLSSIPIALIDPNKFWQNLGIGIASFVNSSTPYSIYTPAVTPINLTTPSIVPGKTAFGKNGSLMYVADTNNNRILIYGKTGALGCETITDKTSDSYKACIFQASGEPYVPLNILGQPTQYDNKTCAQHKINGTVHYGSVLFVPNDVNGDLYNKCLTGPTGVYVDGDNLIISDTGNNRVLVKKILPSNIACDKNMSSNITTVDNCAFDIAVGKKSFYDTTTYTLADGDASLNQPTSLAVRLGNLFILDAGNHRVVRVKQYFDNSYFSCNTSTWRTPLCAFSALLGQRNYFESKKFSGEIAASNVCITNNTVSDPNFLGKYFEDPTAMKITSDGKLLISTFENYPKSMPPVCGPATDASTGKPIEMRSRVLIFQASILDGDSPSCNLASFTATGCLATKVIGQQTFGSIPEWATSTGTFESQVSYGLDYVSDIELTEGNLITTQPLVDKVKIWTDWATTPVQGVPYTYNIINPSGAPNPANTSQSLPTLNQISSVSYNPVAKRFFIHDTGVYRIYEVVGYQ